MESNGALRLIILELKHELLKIAKPENLKLAIVIVNVEGTVVFNYAMDGVSMLAPRQCITKARMLAKSIKEEGATSSPAFGMVEGAVPIVYKEQYLGVLSIAGAKKENDVKIAQAALAHINAV